MTAMKKQAVTGAFGYSGRSIARLLLAQGQAVLTLTNSPQRPHEFGGRVAVAPFNFEQPEALRRSLEGVETLYNTYWVRFNTSRFTHAEAVRNTRTLFQAAQEAGVERIVHVSITNPSLDSPLEYFRGKAELEQALIASGIPYAILRPAVLFGGGDILINNIAWALRRLPVIGMFGDGSYRLQPIHVEDMARLAVRLGGQRENVIVNAIGPETFTYRGLLEALCRILGLRRLILPAPPWMGYAAGRLLGWLMNDVMITRQEIQGLMAGLLYVEAPPAGQTRLTEWARENAATLGLRYASEMSRRLDRNQAY